MRIRFENPIQPCPTAGADEEEDVDEDICRGDDDDDQRTNANVVCHPVQQALVDLMMMFMIKTC